MGWPTIVQLFFFKKWGEVNFILSGKECEKFHAF